MDNKEKLINELTAFVLKAWPSSVDHSEIIATERRNIATYLRRAGFGGSVTAAGVALPDLIRSGQYVACAPASCGIDMVAIPSGRLLMGSPLCEPERSINEGPQHEVVLDGYLMSQTPITQAQWREVAGWPMAERELPEDPSRFKGDSRPVERVSWYDAMEFCRRLSKRTGRLYTLPSEAQWEYACRAGTTTPFAFGETLTTEQANYDGNYTYGSGSKGEYRAETTEVGRFPANAWGLHDMHGNVWEWCLDDWHESYAGAPTNGSAWVEGGNSPGKSCAAARGSSSPGTAARPSASGSARTTALLTLVSASVALNSRKLLRGGSWIDSPGYCRSAYRHRLLPDIRGLYVGFRVCCLPQD